MHHQEKYCTGKEAEYIIPSSVGVCVCGCVCVCVCVCVIYTESCNINKAPVELLAHHSKDAVQYKSYFKKMLHHA